MVNEQTNPTDTQGEEVNTPVESPNQPTSLYDKTEAIVQRQEEANKKTEELLARQETLHANQRLSGTGGGGQEHMTPEDQLNKKAEDEAKGIVDAFR